MALDDHKEKSGLAPGLYIVATPIGNLGDISLRALDVLRAADMVACEDTRVTAKLLTAHGIRAMTTSYNDHNGARKRPELLQALHDGKIVALVSDAGTPLVSDPGYKLVEAVQAEGIRVIPIPGASSVLAALTVAGLPTDRFYFVGFLPAKAQARMQAAQALAAIPGTLVLLESPRRLADVLPVLADALGERQAAVCRELTKRYEEVRRGSLTELAAHYAGTEAPKGEVVLVIDTQEAPREWSEEEVRTLLAEQLEALSVKDAAAAVSEHTGWVKKAVYALALTMKG